MRVFIDESGTFQPQAGQSGAVSLVGALVVPGKEVAALFNEYALLRSSWNIEGEVVGGILDEEEIASVVALASRYGCVFEAVAVEMGLHSDSDIENFKARQAEALLRNITREFSPNLAQELCNLRDSYLRNSNQLVVQGVAFTRLVESVFRWTTLYWSQVRPEELGEFHWVVDSKGDEKYESLWSFLVMPTLDWAFRREELLLLIEGDYSHMEKYSVNSGADSAFEVNSIWHENLRFADSRSDVGLELVHILTNGLRRAYRGRLGFEGWAAMGQLMLMKPSTDQVVPFLAMSSRNKAEDWPRRYGEVTAQLYATSRRPLVSREGELGEEG